MIRRWTAGCASARSVEVARRDDAPTRQSVSAMHPHADRRLGQRRIAPIQVGATWWPTGSKRSSSTLSCAGVPSSSRMQPSRAVRPRRQLAGRDGERGWATAAQRSSAASSRSSKRSIGAQVGDGDAARGHAVGQVLVDERDGHRALPDRAGHALDRAGADVAGDEHAGDAGLEQVGVARSGQPAARASGPARMKPRSSRATTPASQSVRGAAPMKTKQASTSSSGSAPSGPADAQRLAGGRRRPRPPTACGAVRTSMLGRASICSIR